MPSLQRRGQVSVRQENDRRAADGISISGTGLVSIERSRFEKIILKSSY